MKAQYVMGIDFGTSGVRVGIFGLDGREIVFRDTSYELLIPKPGYAEQRPDDWWAALAKASCAAIADSGVSPSDIIGIGTDTTASTLVFLDKHMQPLHNAIMWMDVRAAEQAERASKCGHPVLKFNGYGNVSPEWMPAKVMWVKEKKPELYAKTAYILDCDDWLGYKLTGMIAKNINDAAGRWYYDSRNGGWQTDFFGLIGLEDVMVKIPSDVLRPGERLGLLTNEAAEALGLTAGIPIAVGGADAYIAMLGLGAVRAGNGALITGSSHLLLYLTEKEVHAKGMFGTYPDVIVDGLHLADAGQVSTGSVISWYKNNFFGHLEQNFHNETESAYKYLDREAQKIPIGSNGLICLDYFQGNRSPYTDPKVRGMISGLSLAHSPAHIYRALVESTCYGTEIILRNFRSNGLNPREVCVCGGAAKSRFWMQTHADVSNIIINIPKVSEAPTLGSAILGAVTAGAYNGIVEASDSMVKIVERIEPNAEAHEAYLFYVDKYEQLYPILKDWMHEVAAYETARR